MNGRIMRQRERVRNLVAVVPGNMGSVLARDGTAAWWAWSAVWSRLGSLTKLRLPTDIGDNHPGDGVEAAGVLRTEFKLDPLDKDPGAT